MSSDCQPGGPDASAQLQPLDGVDGERLQQPPHHHTQGQGTRPGSYYVRLRYACNGQI